MPLNQIGQIALAVSNTDVSEAFYGKLGLRKLYRYGNLCFFDCAGVRLMLSPPEDGAPVQPGQGALYFRVADLALAIRQLEAVGVDMVSGPQLTAPMPDHDLWIAFCRDPDAHLIGLMMEAPKGYAPPAA